MNALFALGTLTLIAWIQGESSLNNREKSPDALGKNVIASSYVNTLEICPQEVPRCPGRAEPRCFQDSPHVGSPSQNNTQWRCVLCDTKGDSAPACFFVIPIETYSRRKRMPRNRNTSEWKSSEKAYVNGTRKKTRNENTTQLQAAGTSPPPQPLKQYLEGRAGQPSRINTPQAEPLTTQWGAGLSNQPQITRLVQPPILQSNINQLPLQQSDINQPIQQPTPDGFYPQRPYMPYDQPNSPPANAYVQAPYLPHTQPYVQPQYAGYNADPQYQGLYTY